MVYPVAAVCKSGLLHLAYVYLHVALLGHRTGVGVAEGYAVDGPGAYLARIVNDLAVAIVIEVVDRTVGVFGTRCGADGVFGAGAHDVDHALVRCFAPDTVAWHAGRDGGRAGRKIVDHAAATHGGHGGVAAFPGNRCAAAGGRHAGREVRRAASGGRRRASAYGDRARRRAAVDGSHGGCPAVIVIAAVRVPYHGHRAAGSRERVAGRQAVAPVFVQQLGACHIIAIIDVHIVICGTFRIEIDKGEGYVAQRREDGRIVLIVVIGVVGPAAVVEAVGCAAGYLLGHIAVKDDGLVAVHNPGDGVGDCFCTVGYSTHGGLRYGYGYGGSAGADTGHHASRRDCRHPGVGTAVFGCDAARVGQNPGNVQGVARGKRAARRG